jgi:hypothetical protein
MIIHRMNPMYKHMWWTKRGCEVEVLGTGHFPTTAMVKLLKEDHILEVDTDELILPPKDPSND